MLSARIRRGRQAASIDIAAASSQCLGENSDIVIYSPNTDPVVMLHNLGKCRCSFPDHAVYGRGIEMVREGDRPKSMGGGQVQEDIGIVPFATPFIAGPGAISLVIILMKGAVFTNPLNDLFTIVALALVMLIIYIFFTFSSRITRVLGDKVLKALTRIFGLLVAGFAIQYFINAIIALGVIH